MTDNTLSLASRRNAAWFVKDIYDSERKKLRRKPQDHETIIAAIGKAQKIGDVAFVDHFDRYLSRLVRGEARVKCALASIAGSSTKSPRYTPYEVTSAEAALEYMADAGDLPGDRNNDRNVTDRKILSHLADDWNRDDLNRAPNDSAAGRRLGLSHTTVRDRKIARCERIMNRLRNEFPDIFSVTGCRQTVWKIHGNSQIRSAA